MRRTLVALFAAAVASPFGLFACTSILGTYTVSTNSSPDATAGGDANAPPGTEPATIQVDPPLIDFLAMDCGGPQGDPKTFKITNTSTVRVNWIANLDVATVFSISGNTQGALEPGGIAELAVTANSVDATKESAGDVAAAQLSVAASPTLSGSALLAAGAQAATAQADAGPSDVGTVHVRVQRTARGPQAAIDPPTLDFGVVGLSSTSDLTTTLTNSGSIKAFFTFPDSPPGFSIVSPSPATLQLDPGMSGKVTVRFAGAATAQTFAGNFNVATAGGAKLCKGSAPVIAAKATVSNSALLVSPGTLNFLNVNCGTTGKPQPLTLTNSQGQGAPPLQWSLTLPPGAPFYVLDSNQQPTSTISGKLSGGGSLPILVYPAAVPPTANAGPITSSLTIQAMGQGPPIQPITVGLQEVAQGAQLSYSFSNGAGGQIPAPSGGAQQVPANGAGTDVYVTNTGNLPANVNLFLANQTFTPTVAGTAEAAGDGFALSPNALQVPAGGNSPFNIKLTATQYGSYGATMILRVAGTPTCGPSDPVAPRALSGSYTQVVKCYCCISGTCGGPGGPPVMTAAVPAPELDLR